MDSVGSQNSKHWLSLRLSEMKDRYVGTPVSPDRLYNLGYIATVTCFAVYLLIAIVYPEFKIRVSPAFAMMGVVIWIMAFCIETVALIPKALSNRYFLSAIALASIPVLKFTSMWVGRFINETTGVDPGELPDAVSALLVVFVPISWIYVVFAFLTICLFGMLMFGTLWSVVKHSQSQGRAFLARLLVTIFVVSYGFIFADYIRIKSLEAAKYVIVATEYFTDTRCGNLDAKDLVAHLDSEISIYNPEVKTFKFGICQQ